MENKVIGSETRDLFIVLDDLEKAKWWRELTVEALKGEGFSIINLTEDDGEPIEEEPSTGCYEVTIQAEREILLGE